MGLDSVKICPHCNKSDITSFSKCRFCGTKYDAKSYNDIHKTGLGNKVSFIILAVLICCGLYYAYGSFCVPRTAAEQADMPSGLPDLLAPPVQTTLTPPQVIELKGYKITKVASYNMTARIIASAYNWPDPLNDLSPIDLGLGWGFMADKRVIQQICIVGGGRHICWFPPKNLYRYFPNKQLIETKEIYANSANTHIIPANDKIRKVVESLHCGQVITLSGALVNVTRSGGLYWNTSLSRNDMGEGGCEIMYVDSVQIH